MNKSLSQSYPHAQSHLTWVKRLRKRQERIRSRQAQFEAKRQKLMTWRLVLGLALVAVGMAVATDSGLKWLGLPFLLGLFFFSYMVRASGQVKQHLHQLDRWLQYYMRQSERLLGTYQASSEGTEDLADTNLKVLAKDLYLLGPKSIYNLIDETFTQGGERTLRQWIFEPLSTAQEIEKRQNHVRHLAQYRWPIEKLTLFGGLSASQLRTDDMTQFMERPLVGTGYKTLAALHIILFPLYLVMAVLMANEVIPGNAAWPIVLYAVFSLYSLKQVSDTFRRAEDLELSLASMRPVWGLIETHPEVFREVSSSVFTNSPSRASRPLNWFLAALSVEGHWLVHLIINALTPWSFSFAGLCERWRKKHQAPFLKSIDELFYLEAVASGSLFHLYQTQTYPQFTEESQLVVEQAYHPLIDRQQVVGNSISLKPPLKLALITGSNMSGKSTFLRTLGLNQQLALMGFPVFAISMTTFLGPVYTCLQISDSLEIGYSSFYYEVRRVREIIERAREGQQFLYLIDEIFRGTNNRERLIGSRAVIEQLLSHPSSLGLVSTHDLELTQISETFSQMENFHFRDDVQAGQLTFSYQIHSGPCPTTNALKIMANEGLPVSIENKA